MSYWGFVPILNQLDPKCDRFADSIGSSLGEILDP